LGALWKEIKMKYIDTRGIPITAPIDLGETGRGDDGRTKVSIRISPQAAACGEYGYTVVGGSVVLTPPREGQHGVLLPILTHTGYHRHCSGWSRVVCGSAAPVASGTWADGAAGRIGGGADTLWHITGPVLIEVHYSATRGGSERHWWLVADASGYVFHSRLSDLVAKLVLDDEPRLRDIVKALEADLPAQIAKALATVEEIEDGVCEAAPAAHYGSLADLELVDLVVTDPSRGVGARQGNALPPGERQLAIFWIGPGGGKRYHYDVEEMQGLEVLAEHVPCRSASKLIVAYIASSDWRCRWTNYKDGAAVETRQVP
jgi:hypothetical protein